MIFSAYSHLVFMYEYCQNNKYKIFNKKKSMYF